MSKSVSFVDYDSPVPLYEQIKREIKLQILSEKMKVDEKLPPIREYAKIVKVNPNTIVKVYFQLESEGFLYSRAGQGYFVKEVIREDGMEEKELFKSITAEYLRSVSDLGFSIEYVLKNLKKRQKIK